MAVEGVEFDQAEQFDGAIVFCPICCTNSDAEAYGEQHMECTNCGTKFMVNIEKRIVAEFAIHG